MGMNESELDAVTGALQRIVGRAVAGVWQPTRDRVVLGLSDGTFLLLVPRGPLARVHTVDRRPRNPLRPFSFQGACRARLRGPVISVTKTDGERAVVLRFPTAALHLRLTGRSGGLWLLDGDRVIAAYDGPAPDVLPSLPARPPRADAARFAPVDDSWDLGARRFFGSLERSRRQDVLRADLARRLKRTIARTLRLQENLDGDLDRASAAPQLRARADLLAANLHAVKRGATSVRVTDWSTGDPVDIPLDPERSAAATLETLYRRAGRLERVGDRVLERMEEVAAALAGHQRALRDLPTTDGAGLAALDAALPRGGKGTRGGKGARATVVQRPWTEWNGPEGERVLVGRNARGNRRLTFQVAKGTDWWMHLRGVPGAHAILPMQRGQTPTLPRLLAAAQILLVHARLPEGESADVQYTRVRDVRPIPGEIARVRLCDERVLRVTREPSTLSGWATTDP